MKVFSRRLLISALILIVLPSACNLPTGTPVTPLGTILPEGQATFTPLPTVTIVNETPTALIPVTGMNLVTLQCQFCVNFEPHAVLIVPETAHFNVTDPSIRITCLTAQVVNERRILLCRGAPQTSFSLNVCVDGSSCAEFPVTLETCPISSQAGAGTPQVLPTSTRVVVIPTSTTVPPSIPASTATPPTTQTVFVPPAATATTSHLQPTIAPPLATQPPQTGLNDPEGFARWYFTAVWQQRNYQDLWDNYMTPSFKSRTGSGSFEDYTTWWSSVERVDVHSVQVMQNDGTHAWIRVNVTFIMRDGRIVSNQQYDYDLLYDPTRQSWMFDYRT